jgi:hypothetical protein
MTESKASSKTRQIGLRLTLAGAPNEIHSIPGLSVLLRPDRPTPVGGPGELAAEEARAFAKNHPDAVEVVDLKDDEVDRLRALAAHDHERARGNTIEPPKGQEG